MLSPSGCCGEFDCCKPNVTMPTYVLQDVVPIVIHEKIMENKIPFFLISYGNWGRIDKTKMTRNGLRIFLDRGSGPFRYYKWLNLGNKLEKSTLGTIIGP